MILEMTVSWSVATSRAWSTASAGLRSRITPCGRFPCGTTRWSGGHDVILREDAGIWLWARCRTAAIVADRVRRSTPPTGPPVSLRDELRVNSMP